MTIPWIWWVLLVLAILAVGVAIWALTTPPPCATPSVEIPPVEERPHLPKDFRPRRTLSVRDRLALRQMHAWEQEIAEHREAVRG